MLISTRAFLLLAVLSEASCSGSGSENTAANKLGEAAAQVAQPSPSQTPAQTVKPEEPLLQDDAISKGLEPLWSNAPRQAILGVRLGMTYGEVKAKLTAQGYEASEPKRRSIQNVGDFIDRARFGKPSDLGDPEDRLVAYFTTSTKPQLFGLYRQVSFPRDKEIPYPKVVAALTGKYGKASSVIERPRADTEWLIWPADNNANCDQDLSALMMFGTQRNYDARGFSQTGCVNGFLTALISRNEAQQPVGLIKSYLVDSEIDAEDRRLVKELALQAAEKKRKEELEKAQAPSF